MSNSAPVIPDSGLEVDWRQQQSQIEGLQKHQGDNEGLQHVYGPNPNAVASGYSVGYSRRILGLSIGMFWLVVAVIVLVLAGGIGGGVAGGLAAQKNSCSQPQSSSSTPLASVPSVTPTSTTSTSTTSSTTTAATGSPSPQILTPCTNPSNNGTTLIANDPTGSNTAIGVVHFLLVCNTNYPAGSAYGNPNLVDLYRLYTPDMTGCITACAEYNIGYAVSSGGPRCAAVAVVKTPGEFCYLKSATGVNNTSSSGGTPIDSAVLLS